MSFDGKKITGGILDSKPIRFMTIRYAVINAMCTHVALAAQPLEQVVRLELVLLVGHYARHFERQPGFGHLVLEQALAHGVERRRHHVARGHRPEVVHHQHCPRGGVETNTCVYVIIRVRLFGGRRRHTTPGPKSKANVARRPGNRV